MEMIIGRGSAYVKVALCCALYVVIVICLQQFILAAKFNLIFYQNSVTLYETKNDTIASNSLDTNHNYSNIANSTPNYYTSNEISNIKNSTTNFEILISTIKDNFNATSTNLITNLNVTEIATEIYSETSSEITTISFTNTENSPFSVKVTTPEISSDITTSTTRAPTNISQMFDEFVEMYQKNEAEHSDRCVLPVIDPYDPMILRYLRNVSAINCGYPQPPLTYIDPEGFLRLNTTAGDKFKLLKCQYQEILRVHEDDKNIKLGHVTEMDMKNANKVPFEFIAVKCLDNGSLVYETAHFVMKPLSPELEESSKKAHEAGAINVFISMLDSMSYLNFQRQLPVTLDFLKNKLDSVIFKGHTKLGLNTLPNTIAMLAGLVTEKFKFNSENIASAFNLTPNTHFDDVPFVWKNFSSRGYVTLFSEESPLIAVYDYLLKGFKRPPTDWYVRPLYLAVEKMKSFKSKDGRCYAHVPKHEFVWNYTENFIQKMHSGGNAFFAIEMMTALSHDDVNNIQVVDDVIVGKLARLFERGVFNNTLFIMMGDHGNRLHPIRTTEVGSVEDRMPYFSISLPEKLKHLRPILAENAKILTSWHDVHETLLDVVTDNLQPQSRVVRYGYFGSSLFRPLNSSRNCHEIGIHEDFCVCNLERDFDVNSSNVQAAAQIVVDRINKLLVEGNVTSLCANWTFHSILHASFSLMKTRINKIPEIFVYMRITISTLPGEAKFEGTIKLTSSQLLVYGEVNRIDVYANQSLCIHDKKLERYCYCK